MTATITKTYKEHLPSVRFIGKRYTNADKGIDGGFGNKWSEWFENGWFNELEQLGNLEGVENGHIGLMGCSEEDNSFEYWIGIFLPEKTPVPENYDFIDIPEGDVGVCWIYGSADSGELFGQEPHNMCMSKLEENNMGRYRDDFNGEAEKWWWFFERYNCPRFTTPDEHGKVILDYGMYIV